MALIWYVYFFPVVCIYSLVLLDKINNNIKENMHTPLILSKKKYLNRFPPHWSEKNFLMLPISTKHQRQGGLLYTFCTYTFYVMIKLYIHFSYIAQINLYYLYLHTAVSSSWKLLAKRIFFYFKLWNDL